MRQPAQQRGASPAAAVLARPLRPQAAAEAPGGEPGAAEPQVSVLPCHPGGNTARGCLPWPPASPAWPPEHASAGCQQPHDKPRHKQCQIRGPDVITPPKTARMTISSAGGAQHALDLPAHGPHPEAAVLRCCAAALAAAAGRRAPRQQGSTCERRPGRPMCTGTADLRPPSPRWPGQEGAAPAAMARTPTCSRRPQFPLSCSTVEPQWLRTTGCNSNGRGLLNTQWSSRRSVRMFNRGSLARVNLQDSGTVCSVGQRKVHLSVKAPGTPQRQVDGVRPAHAMQQVRCMPTCCLSLLAATRYQIGSGLYSDT